MNEHTIFYAALCALCAPFLWVGFRSLRIWWRNYGDRIGIRQAPRLSVSKQRYIEKSNPVKQEILKAHAERNPLDSLPLERKP